MPITVPGKRSRTAAAITCAVEWRRVSRSSLMPCPSRGAADYTERVGGEPAGLNRSESLETGRGVFPAEGSVVERGLAVPGGLEDEGGLMRPGDDPPAMGLTAKGLPSATGPAPGDD